MKFLKMLGIQKRTWDWTLGNVSFLERRKKGAKVLKNRRVRKLVEG